MKKSLVVVALLVMSIAALWAGGSTERGSRHLSVGGSYGFAYELEDDALGTPGLKAEGIMHSFAPNLTVFQTSETSDWNFFFDMAYENLVSQSIKLSNATSDSDWQDINLDAFESIFYLDMEFGSLYSVIENSSMHVAIGPVFSMQGFFSEPVNGYSDFVYYFGLGANIHAMYFLNEVFFLKAGASLTVNPYLTNFYDSKFVFNLGIDPSIGIGIKY